MSEFNSSKNSPIIPTAFSSSHVVADVDFEEDACSICLDPFSVADPATVTTCRHDYHLHCILEWSQRSKECPICWQALSLKDPSSQELLANVEIERNARRRRMSVGGPTYPRQHPEFVLESGPHWTDDPDFSERITQHLAAMMSRARQAHRSERHRSSERSPSPVLAFPSRLSESSMHPNTPEEGSSTYGSSGGSSPVLSISSLDAQPSLSPTASLIASSSGSATRRAVNQSSSQSSDSAHSTQRQRSAELVAFSESIKSKLSAASTRYKDSISKSTQGFREKLLARNDSVKKMSKGVQREMSSSIAGVTRMIERLDLKYKQKSASAEGIKRVGETSNLLSKGKGVLDNLIASSREDHAPAELHGKPQDTCSISGR